VTGGKTPAPWLLVRARLATAWHCRPSDIDPDEDADEIGVQLELWSHEAKYTPKDGD